MTYHRLAPAERYVLAALRRQGRNQAEIARPLGSHRSTFCRELRRNSTRADGRYRAFTARARTRGRRSRPRRNRRFTAEDFALVEGLLCRQWSRPRSRSSHVTDYLAAPAPPPDAEPQPLRFDPRLAAPFCEKSLSEETRRAYRRVVKEFFLFVKGAHPSQVTPAHVLSWRDRLKGERKKAVTISFKLTDESRAIRGRVQAVVRSRFYLPPAPARTAVTKSALPSVYASRSWR